MPSGVQGTTLFESLSGIHDCDVVNIRASDGVRVTPSLQSHDTAGKG
jgi:hypothetical protein